jgi:hypothetical protein
MFSNGELSGILLTLARPEITAYQSTSSKTGMNIRIRIMFRANLDFLTALQRKFETMNINSKLRSVEGVNRAKPVLIVSKRKDLESVRELMNKELPCSRTNWTKFDSVLHEMSEKNHLEEEGMKRILEMVYNENDILKK